jgi:cytochrome c biogenesis protein ResB
VRDFGKKAERFLGSPRLAIGLMIYLGVVAYLGTLVPQGSLDAPKVAEWVAAHPASTGVVRFFGLHSVYTAWYFLLGAALLAASTAVCAWRRTSVALRRFRVLRSVARADAVPRPDFSVRLADGTDASAALDSATAALDHIGLKLKRREDRLALTSWPYSVFASSVFHWSLLLLIIALFAGALVRSEGLMGVPLGESRPNVPASYGVVSAGPWHSWTSVKRVVGVEDFKLVYVVGDMDRGPTPLVVIKDDTGKVLIRQVVYPNYPLRHGSVIVHPNEYGLAASFALIGSDGAERARSTEVLDFAKKETGFAGPSAFALTGASTAENVEVRVRVPLERQGRMVKHSVPASPTAQFAFTAPGGKEGSATLQPGQSMPLPDGSQLRLLGVTYYARLSVVDDPTVPVIYFVLVVGLIAVSVALLARQRVVVVYFAEAADARSLDVTARLWRNAGVTSTEIRTAIEDSLAEREEEQGA